MVKDEKNYDKFDRAFAAYFKGLEDLHGLIESLIPRFFLELVAAMRSISRMA